MSSKETQFNGFESITSQDGSSVSPAVVSFDKRTLYIGTTRSIKLKELNRVNVQQQEEDGGYYDGNDRRFGRISGSAFQQRQRRLHGARHHQGGTVVTFQGKDKTFTCITYDANDQFHNFVEQLKQIHRKVKLKHDQKDPYAAAATNNSSGKARGGGAGMRSNYRKPLITPTVSRSNQQQQQQQSRASSLHMTPQKMKQSSGAFLSRSSANNNNVSSREVARGNVLNDNSNSNNNQITSPSLKLPPKSPRNATPTKLRQNDNDDEEDEFDFDNERRSSSRVLFDESVAKREKKRNKMDKLRRKVEEKMLNEFSDDDEEEDVEMKQVEEEEEEEEEVMEKSVIKKKKRLRRAAVQKNDESDGSDVEFDVDSSSAKGDVRKKLRLEDDDDDDDTTDSPSPAREERVKKTHVRGKTITDEDTSRETSPVTTEDAAATAAADEDLEDGSEEKPSAKKGQNTLHSFFPPRSAAPPSNTKSTSSSSTTAIPPTPTKKKIDVHPSTPSSSSQESYSWKSASSTQVETTPIPMQKQANTWGSIASTPTAKKPAYDSLVRSPDEYKRYYNHRKTPIGGYPSEDDEEEVDDIYADDNDENTASPTAPPTPQMRTTFQHQQRNRNPRRGRQAYGRMGRMGHSRIGRSRIPNPYENDKFRSSILSEADSALGRKSLHRRTQHRDMSRRRLGPFPAMIEDQNDNEEEEEDDKPKIPGIQNLGNTCYLSASLQTLYSIPEFLGKLYTSYEELSATKDLPLTTALLEVALTIGALKQEDVPLISSTTAQSTLLSSKAANPSALKTQMDVLTEKFAGYEQRDAHEFLGDLVDFLHEELVGSPSDETENDDNPKKSEESNSDDAADDEEVPATVVTTDLPTDKYFHTKVRVCLKCKSCGYSRSKEELYRHLSIDVGENDEGESWGVERSLEHFFQAEDREVNCEKCEEGTSATQTMEIISRPKAILLHFKRFIVSQRENGEMVLRKNKAKIPLKESLSISSFCSEEDKPKGLYHLCSVVHHVGNTASSGHYTTCGKRKLEEESVEEQWVFFDDTVGKRRTFNYVSESETNQKNCYMALYELK